MDKSLTADNLNSLYNNLYEAIKGGNLSRVIDSHLKISEYLKSSGAVLLANRHQNMALRARQIVELITSVPVSASDGAVLASSSSMDAMTLNSALPIRNEWYESLELKLISLLCSRSRSQDEVLQSLFGGYSSDISSEKILNKVILNINRHIARIIDVSPEKIQLRLA